MKLLFQFHIDNGVIDFILIANKDETNYINLNINKFRNNKPCNFYLYRSICLWYKYIRRSF